MLEKCAKIAAHGINCFINRQLIYNLPEQYFTEHKITSIEHADFEGVDRLARVLGCEIASTFDSPELVKIGQCKLIEEVLIGEDKVIRFSGCAAGEACTFVLRGATSHMLDEAERSIHDALCVVAATVKESRYLILFFPAKMPEKNFSRQFFFSFFFLPETKCKYIELYTVVDALK